MQNKHWQALVQHQQNFGSSLQELFKQDAKRFQHFSLEACDILFDYSKQRIQNKTIDLLSALALESNIEQARQDLFSGAKINQSEDQAALHTALRDLSPNPLDGPLEKNRQAEVLSVLKRLETFSEDVRHHRRLSATGKPFKDIICLGIGGSELGPSLLCQALKEYKTTSLQMHFVSNVDGKTLGKLLDQLDPQSSLCIISSKTFTTSETLQNAKIVKAWFQKAFPTKELAKHLVAVTAAHPLAINFGVSPENIFEFWSWVGGRYSVWSAVGLPAILSMGMTNFKAFLAGAHEMDKHFQSAPLRKNMPVMMALISIWNRNFWHFPHQGIIPYDDGLEKLPNYIQQLEMESNGKSVNQQGERLSYQTAPLIWGGVGCNSQHAFMQLLHQGTDIIPVDFLIGVQSLPDLPLHQQLLLANCFAQSKALMEGYQGSHNKQDYQGYQGDPIPDIARDPLSQAKYCPGNRPSSTLIYPKLTPKILGSLLALFEHKVYVQGVIWGINSFDQWGVELGKKLANHLLHHLDRDEHPLNLKEQQLDSSTEGLMQFVKKNGCLSKA